MTVSQSSLTTLKICSTNRLEENERRSLISSLIEEMEYQLDSAVDTYGLDIVLAALEQMVHDGILYGDSSWRDRKDNLQSVEVSITVKKQQKIEAQNSLMKTAS